MFLATINKSKQLLHLSLIGKVAAEELARGRDEAAALLSELSTGFRQITDLGRLESIDVGCAAEIGRLMELCDQKGVAVVVRVIPDPTKDIGFNILSFFHYQKGPRMMTCQSMVEAARLLSL